MSYTDMMGQNTTCAISNRCGSGGFTPFGAEVDFWSPIILFISASN